MNIQLSVAPEAGSVIPDLKRFITVEVVYSRELPKVAETADEEAEGPVSQTMRLGLDQALKGTLELTDAADPPSVQAGALSADGTRLFFRTLPARADGVVTLTLTQDDIQKIAKPDHQALPDDPALRSTTRMVTLLATGTTALDYARSSVVVSAVKNAIALDKSGVDALLQSGGTRISSIEVTGQDLGMLGRLEWEPAHLAVNGTLTARFNRVKTIGWLWWLNGPAQVLGFVPDDLDVAEHRPIVIALPALAAKGVAVASTREPACSCERKVPSDVTEAELANNPAIYSEDPGAFCKPFSNPERVLSERSFSVIARITQPEIGAMASVNVRGLKQLTLEGDSAASPARSGGIAGLFRTSSGTARLTAMAEASAPVRHTLVRRYQDLLGRLPVGRGVMNAQTPLQWEDDIAQYQATSVALGHILEYRVRWRSNGYSLGNVAKTLTLAPRQAKRIQKIEWERSERAQRTEVTRLRDDENDTTVRERDYADHVAANLSEWATGGSTSSTAAVAGGIGFFGLGVLGGIGGGAATARSSSHQEGGRHTTASEDQRLRDAIRRHGDALRKFESTVVNEISQDETVTGTTEVIRNANYAHSLTVIYYQILRHLKVNTEFAGARECVFVPFAIRPFDLQRAYRWRESIQASIRSMRYSRALSHLKDVLTNFTTSDIEAGPRAGQRLTYLRGSIYVNLGVERPRDTADGGFDVSLWRVVQPLLGSPALGIFSILSGQSPAQRERVFQAEHAPGMAARWANRLTLKVGNRLLHADCTLATRYGFNHSVRIDFSVPAEALGGLRRRDMVQITVVPFLGLPPGSVANLTRISLVYNTARFERAVEGRTGTNDLVNAESGTPSLATVAVPLDSWERVDERLEIRRSVDQLLEHLNEHVEYYHKAIWWRMDRDRLLMMLDGFYIPGTNSVSLASVVDREPIGIIGNSLVYRVGAASFIGYGQVASSGDLYNVYATREPVADPVLVSLPTDGLYAQTIMDECVALEEHFGNLDWVLNDKEPELGSLDPSLLMSRRADPTPALTPTPLPATIISLQNAAEAPAPSGLQGVLNAVTTASAFRDMAGLAGTQANAAAALTTAAGLATNFGNQAAALEMAKLAKAEQATKTADQKLASIKGAVDKGLASPQEGAKAAKEVLAAMNPDSAQAEAPHENAAINAAIDTAKFIPGSTIEAATGAGGVKVTVGGDPAEFEDRNPRSFIVPVPATHDPQNRSFNPRRGDKSGQIVLKVQLRNAPAGGSARWSVPPDQTGHYTLAGSAKVQTGLRADVTGLMPGDTFIDVELLDASGTVIESEKYKLNIPQFVSVDVDPAFTAVLTGYGLIAEEIEVVLGAAKRVADTILSESNVRTVWRMAPFTEALPAQFAAGGAAASNVTLARLMGDPPPGVSLYGNTTDRNGSGGINALVGPQFFDELIVVFAGAYDDPVGGGANEHVDEMTNEVVRAIRALGGVSSQEKDLAMRVLGRLYGETLAHEIVHSLIGGRLSDVGHNAHPGILDDLMNWGNDRSFEKRTGFVVDPVVIGSADILTLLAQDKGIQFINIPTGTAKQQIDTFFPVPPAFK